MKRFISKVVASLTMVAAVANVASAAERPLGHVETVTATGTQQTVALTFDASVQLAPGSVVAVYAPGLVERHPLTNEVIIEERRLIAKVQIISGAGGVYQSRLAWKAPDSTLVTGQDCVPLPADAAPNGAPFVAEMKSLTVNPGEVVTLELPIKDPDTDPLVCTWSIAEHTSGAGRFLASVTYGGSNVWVAPIQAGSLKICADVADPYGHTTKVTLDVTIVGDVDARARSVSRIGSMGFDEHLTALTRASDGSWVSYDTLDAHPVVHGAGWWLTNNVKPSDSLGSFNGLATFGTDIHVVDGSGKIVRVMDRKGKTLRTYGDLLRPTDIVIDQQGVSYVADYGLGGVAVYEADGSFRYRLGREGKSADSFDHVERVDVRRDGTLACLDTGKRRILQYDRFGRRLGTWTIGGDVNVGIVDIAWHPAGLLILAADGRVMIMDKAGVTGTAWAGPVSKDWGLEFGTPDGVYVDVTGASYVTYARERSIVRRNNDGVVDGVRCPSVIESATGSRLSGAGQVVTWNRRTSEVDILDSEGFVVRVIKNAAKDISDIAVMPDGSNIYVLDDDNYNVRRYDLTKVGAAPIVIGVRGTNQGQLKSPIKINTDSKGRVYVLDAGLRRVAVFDGEGQFLFNVDGSQKGSAFLDDPTLLAVSLSGDACYVYDADVYQIRKYALDQDKKTAAVVTSMGGKGKSPGQLYDPTAIGCDRMGLLYCFDSGRRDLQLIDFRGSNAVVLQTWGYEKHLNAPRIDHASAGPDAVFLAGPEGRVHVFRW